MTKKVCPVCEQRPPVKRIKFLTQIREAMINFYDDTVPACDLSELEVTVRIAGEVIEIIPPGAFDLVTDEDNQ